MTTDHAELKEFISLSMTGLSEKVEHLSAVVERQNALIRQIEITSTTRIAEVQKDIEELRRDVTDVKQQVKGVEDSQKFKWKTLTEERAAEKKEQAKKDEDQAVINEGTKTIKALLWTIITILLSIGIPFLWELVKNGGVKGITP